MSSELLASFGRRIRWGMVGGGLDSLIGESHRLSARVDDCYELVAGAMSIDPEIAAASAASCLIAPSRSYEDFREMAEAESRREGGVEIVTVATPPNQHAEVSTAFLESGISVICEKPLTSNLAEAIRLQECLEGSDCLFCTDALLHGLPHGQGSEGSGFIGGNRRDYANPVRLSVRPVHVRRARSGKAALAFRTGVYG